MKPTDVMSEKDWQRQVVELAEYLGWRALHVYPLRSKTGPRTPTTIAGWPDLLLWNTRNPARGLIALELKAAGNYVTRHQALVLAELAASGVRTMVAYPADLDAVQTLLSTTPG